MGPGALWGEIGLGGFCDMSRWVLMGLIGPDGPGCMEIFFGGPSWVWSHYEVVECIV